MTDRTCPVRGCGVADPETGRRTPRPLIGAPGVCEYHESQTASALRDVLNLYDELRCALLPGQAVGERVGGTRTPPLPLNAHARSLQEDVFGLMRSVERAYRRRRGWSPMPLRGRERVAVSRSAEWLWAHLDELLTVAEGVELACGLLAWRGAVRRFLGLTRLVHRLPAPCPSCDCLALQREDGADRVECVQCERIFTEDEYERLVLILTSGGTV